MNRLMKIYTWVTQHSFRPLWRAQAKVASLWVVREIRKVLKPDIHSDMSRNLDHFQRFLGEEIFEELCTGHGCFIVENAQIGAVAPIFARALDAARIERTRRIVSMLPHVRIRIVPGWVKVYLINLPGNAPLAAYRDEAVLGGYAQAEPMLKVAA